MRLLSYQAKEFKKIEDLDSTKYIYSPIHQNDLYYRLLIGFFLVCVCINSFSNVQN